MCSRNRFVAPLLAAVAMLSPAAAMADPAEPFQPLTIQEQGSFAVGGTVAETPGAYNNNTPTSEGQSFHGDHLYAFYQVPQNPKALPIVMLHGAYGLGSSLQVVAQHARDARLVEGFTMEAPQERQTIERVTEWLDGLDAR